MMEIIVFTISGATFHFKNVKEFKLTTKGFTFTYVGESTGVERKAVFDYTSTAGYAIA